MESCVCARNKLPMTNNTTKKRKQSKLLKCLQFDILEIPISVLFGKIKNSNAVIWELLGKDI